VKIKFGLVLIAVLLANLLLGGVASAQTSQTEIYVFPVTNTATTCEDITFGIWVKNVVDLTAFHLEISFDPGSVEVVKVENGGFLGTPTEEALFEPTNGIYNGTGKILFGVAQQGLNGELNLGNGEGKLIEITLRAKTPGSLVPFTIDGTKSVLVNWPDAFQIPFTVTGPGVVSTSSCAPTNIDLSANTIENGSTAGTIVGTLATTDPDSSLTWGDSWTYSLPNSSSYPDNALFAISGDKLSTGFTADYGAKNTYTILVRSTDAGGKYYEKSFTINVVDTVAPTIGAMVAFGAGNYGDVTASGTTFTVPEGYTVEKIEISMSEPVTVVAGSEVTLAGVPYGLVTVSSDGLTLTVIPYVGNEVASQLGTFTFSVPDGSVKDLSGKPLATLSATLIVTAQTPVAMDDFYLTNKDVPLNFSADLGVLANDIGVDTGLYQVSLLPGEAEGVLALNHDGSFVYTPKAGVCGVDTFTYSLVTPLQALAADGGNYEALVTITVNCPPVVSPIPAQDATVGTPLTFQVVASDADLPSGAALTFSLQNAPAGAAINPSTGEFTWTPTEDQSNQEFIFKVCARDGITTTCQDLSIKVATAVVPPDEYKLYLPFIAR